MASSVIGQLRVALSLGTAEFESGAAKAASVAKTRAKEIEGAFSGAKAAVSGLFAAFTVGVLTEQVKKSLEYAGSLREVANTLGVTTTQLQQFRYVASQTGVSQEALELGLKKLNISMGNAEAGSQKAVKAFAALHITVADLKGQNAGDIFLRVADGLSKYSDRAQRAAIETALMSRNGSGLDNALKGGSARINELSEAANRLGIVLSSSAIAGAEETAHKLEAVKMVLSAQIAGVVAQNASAILSLSSALASLTGSIVKFLGSNPQLALGIIGALLGGRVGGLPGAVLGGAAGALLGGRVAQNAADSNPDLTFRTQQMRAAQQRYSESLNGAGGGPAMSVNGMQVAGGAPDSAAARAEFIKQIHLLQQATAQSLANSRPGPKGADIPQFLGGKEKKPKKPPEDKTEQDEFEFAQQQRQVDLQILEAKKALSHDYVEQTTLSIQALDIQKAITNADLDHKLAQAKRDLAAHKITDETYKQLVADVATTRAKEKTLDGLRRQAVLEAEQEQRFHDVAALDQQALDFRRSHLQDELALATTAKQRRDLELKILDVDYQIQKAKLDEVLADDQASDQAKELARRQLAALNEEQSAKRQDVIQQTRGPLEQWAASVPHDAATINEALQSIAVKGLDGLSGAITGVITGTESLKSAFHDLAASIVSELIQMTIKMLLFKALSAAFGSIGGGVGGGGGGGGGGGTVDLTGPEYASQLGHFATGGFVSGSGGPKSDSIPAMLSNGEYVMSAEAVRKFGVRFLDSLNNGRKAFADGGLVGEMPIARTTYGGQSLVGGGEGGRPTVSLVMHNDFRGVDPSSVQRLETTLDQFRAELPSRIVQTINDAKSRLVLR